MKFNVGTLGRMVRGLVGVTLVIIGIMNASWLGLPGVLLLFSAISGKCGFGNTSCEIEPDSNSENK